MKNGLMFAGALLCFAGAATAGETAAKASTPAATVTTGEARAGDDDSVRCKRMPVTGSRVGKSVCHTEREWAAMEQGATEFMRDLEGQPRRDARYETNDQNKVGDAGDI